MTAPRDAQDAAAHAAARDRALVERSGALLAVVDAAGHLAFASPAFARLLGCGEPPQLGRPVLELVHEEDVPRALAMRQALDAARGTPVSGELRVRHHDGSVRTLGLSAEDLRDDPAVRGFVVAARDLTERVALEAQLRQSTKLEAIGRLAGGVAHDFNNLLMIVGGNAQLVRGRLERAGLPCDELDEVEQAVERATALTRQLLAVGRTRPRAASPRVDAGALVRGLAPLLGHLVGEDVALALHVDAPADAAPLLVALDAPQLEQVVLNLVVNARDAVREAARTGTPPAGGVAAHAITVALRLVTLEAPGRRPATVPADLPAGPYVVLTVRDTGGGMDVATRERIFEPFFTTKARDEGTGLGLPMVYAAARQARGTVRVDSAPGAGTTAEVLLPLLAGAPPSAPEARRAGDAGLPTGDETILLVEDEPAVRATIRRLLARFGYAVLEAEHGVAALARLREQGVVADGGSIALVLSDVVMPEMGAELLLEHLRREFPRVPVVLMSGYNETAVRGTPTGGTHPFAGVVLLEKPIPPETLARKLRQQLDRAASGAGPGSSAP